MGPRFLLLLLLLWLEGCIAGEEVGGPGGGGRVGDGPGLGLLSPLSLPQ